ncbi:hypothetical protein FTO74_17320 [Granulicella sp. WH15]|uniref:hypothetical protein n=1 Tax=Granulicella sp. WH15 TaxID=2602070 RepID=UPI0013678498|nr:hypothetical protein [Granulicella sp. WH15]QHN04926.1 hypothetical protein FTO74_17320 [Granulicella sp. WH15]
MSLSENYQCDVCGTKKTDIDRWWLAWLDCQPLDYTSDTQPLLKFTGWQLSLAHSPDVKHLCGARCAGTMMDRWMAEQHENPESQCAH